MQEFRFEEYFDGTYAAMSYEGDEPDVSAAKKKDESPESED